MKPHITEQNLRRRVWWWRRGTEQWRFNDKLFTTELRPGSTDTRWKRSLERVAWNWELVRRLDRSQDLPPFVDLPSSSQTSVEAAMVTESSVVLANTERGYVVLGGTVYSIDSDESGLFTRFDLSEMLRLGELFVPKGLGGAAIASEIQCAVDSLVKEKLLPTPAKSQSTKAPSWRWPELLDIFHFKIRPLTNGERSQKSDAMKAAKLAERKFRAQFVNSH